MLSLPPKLRVDRHGGSGFLPAEIPVSARRLEWWNGRHEGLKILWPLRLCGFESRFEYRRVMAYHNPSFVFQKSGARKSLPQIFVIFANRITTTESAS